MCRLPFPDPVHHDGGTLLEDVKISFCDTLRGIQEQVQVQVTRALDLDFAAQVFWEKCGRGSFRYPPPICSLAKGARPPCPPLSSVAPRSLPRLPTSGEPAPLLLWPRPRTTPLPPPQALTLFLLGGICGSKQVGQGGAQGRGHILREVIRVRLWGKSHWGQPGPEVGACRSLRRVREATHGGRWAPSHSRPHCPGTPALQTLSEPNSRSSGS